MSDADAEYVDTCAKMDALIASFRRWKIRSTVSTALVLVTFTALLCLVGPMLVASLLSPALIFPLFLAFSGLSAGVGYSVDFLRVLHRRPNTDEVPPSRLVEVHRDEAPALWETLDAAAASLGSALEFRVHVDLRATACALQLRTGPHGELQHHLVVGFPFLAACSGEHVRAVLTHEVAHHAHEDTTRSRAIAELQLEFLRLRTSLQHRKSFYHKHIASYVRTTSTALDELNLKYRAESEARADAAAARLFGINAVQDSLAHVRVIAWVVDCALSRLEHVHATDKTPPTEVAQHLQAALQRLTAAEAAALSERLLAGEAEWRESGFSDTAYEHRVSRDKDSVPPPHSERWTFGGQRPTALATFFADPERLTAQLSAVWYRDTLPDWTEAVARREQLATHLDHPGFASQPPSMQLNLAMNALDLPRAASAVAAIDPNAAGAEDLLQVGRYFLWKDDERGVNLVTRAVRARPIAGRYAVTLLLPYFLRQSDIERSSWARRQLVTEKTRHAAAQQERCRFQVGVDQCMPHGLEDEDLDALRESCVQLYPLQRAYLVRKIVTIFPEAPSLLLVLVLRENPGKRGVFQADDVLRALETLRRTYPTATFDVYLHEHPSSRDPWLYHPNARLR